MFSAESFSGLSLIAIWEFCLSILFHGSFMELLDLFVLFFLMFDLEVALSVFDDISDGMSSSAVAISFTDIFGNKLFYLCTMCAVICYVL